MGKIFARFGAAIVGVVLFVVGAGGAFLAIVSVAETAWGWLFLVVPAAALVAVILIRIGARLLVRAIDG